MFRASHASAVLSLQVLICCATGRGNRKDARAQLANASTNYGDCVQQTMLHANVLFSTPFLATLVSSGSISLKGSFFSPRFSSAVTVMNRSKRAFSTAFSVAWSECFKFSRLTTFATARLIYRRICQFDWNSRFFCGRCQLWWWWQGNSFAI